MSKKNKKNAKYEFQRDTLSLDGMFTGIDNQDNPDYSLELTQVDERKAAIIATQIKEEDSKTLNTNLDFYQKNVDEFEYGTDEERARQFRRLHQIREFSGWALGKLLIKQREEIETNKNEEYKTFDSWFNAHRNIFGFSKGTAGNYMKTAESYSLQEYEKLGLVVCLTLVKELPDQKERNKIIKKLVKKVDEKKSDNQGAAKTIQKLSVKEVKEEISSDPLQLVADKEIDKVKEKQKKEKQKIKEQAHGNHIMNIYAQSQQKDGKIVIEVHPGDHDRMIELLNNDRPRFIIRLEL